MAAVADRHPDAVKAPELLATCADDGRIRIWSRHDAASSGCQAVAQLVGDSACTAIILVLGRAFKKAPNLMSSYIFEIDFI